MIDLNEWKFAHADGIGVVTFPHLVAWISADPNADPEAFRGIAVAEVDAAIAYTRALIGVALADLNPGVDFGDDDINTTAFADLDDVTLSAEGGATVTRRLLADALARAASYLGAVSDVEHGTRDAADVMTARQAHQRRADAVVARIDALAQGDPDLAREIGRQCPDPWQDIDRAESAVSTFEADVRIRTVARAADALALAHSARQPHTARDLPVSVAPIEGTD